MSSTSLIVQSKQNRLKCSRNTSVHGVEMGEGTRAFCFPGDGALLGLFSSLLKGRRFCLGCHFPASPPVFFSLQRIKLLVLYIEGKCLPLNCAPALKHPLTMTSNTLTPSLVKISLTILLSSTTHISLFLTCIQSSQQQRCRHVKVGPALQRSKGEIKSQDKRQQTSNYASSNH